MKQSDVKDDWVGEGKFRQLILDPRSRVRNLQNQLAVKTTEIRNRKSEEVLSVCRPVRSTPYVLVAHF